METRKQSGIRCRARVLLAGVVALLLVTSLSLLFAHSQALAQPIAETTTLQVTRNVDMDRIGSTFEVTGTGELLADAVEMAVLDGPPAAQIRSPNRDAVIAQKGSLNISGFAWDPDTETPFLTGDVFLSINRVTENAYVLSWTPVVSASYYLVEEATDPQFSDAQIVYFDTGIQHSVAKNENGTYYYRVKASSEAGAELSRYSNVESVVIPWVMGLTSSPVPTQATQVATAAGITVEVGIDGANWHIAEVTATDWGGWEWSYDWPLPEEDNVQHTIHARASYVDGVPGTTDIITVTVDNQYFLSYMPLVFLRWPPIPYGPTLNDISNPDKNGDYSVVWSYTDTSPAVPSPTSYTLQEAEGSTTNFVDVYSGSSTSYAFTDKEGGTYYYRVRGHNAWGPGEWSSIKSVEVRTFSFHYDFTRSFAKPAWPVRRTSYWKGDSKGVTWSEEHDDTLYMVMADRWDFSIASPWEQAPPPPYVIKTRVKVHDASNLIAYGIIFGGNDGDPCPAYRDTGCLSHYYRLEAIWDGGSLKAGFKRIDYHEPESSGDRGKARGKELISYRNVTSSPDHWHTWEFRVKPDGITIYFDGSYFGATSDSKYVNDPYFGVYASANEYHPAIGRFDYYYVDPD